MTSNQATTTTPRRPDQFDVLGTPISAVRLEDVLRFVDETIEAGDQHHVCVCATNNVMSARQDEFLMEVHKAAGLCVPDGYPLARIGRSRMPEGSVERIRGTDLTLALAEHCAREGHSLFLYGAAPGVPEEMAEALQRHEPGLEVVGCHSPPFRALTPEEDEAEVALINEADPDIVLVGLPTPKQDRWMYQHRGRVNAHLMFGVGAAFDFIAGTKEQAPAWASDRGLEWLYRFLQEPRRLWPRVLVQGPQFVGLLAWDSIKRALPGSTE